MRVIVTVKPGKKKASVEVSEDGIFIVSVSARAIDGKANEAVCLALARHFGVASSRVTIERGTKSRKKIVYIFS